MKKLFFLIFFLIKAVIVFAQGENNNWYFGSKAGVNFSTIPPQAIDNSEMDTFEGVATVSDSLGHVLFYSDGRRIWNKNNSIMINGDNLTSSGRDAYQGVVIVPFPGRLSKYLVFTTNGGAVIDGSAVYDYMAYSIVDMNLNNGLGGVAELNVPLIQQNGTTQWGNSKLEAITVVNAGTHYWVLIPHLDKLLAYKVDYNGVNTVPVISNINYVYNIVTQIKVSPNNNILAITEHSASRVSLYNFDINTGKVIGNNPFTIINSLPNKIYSSEFTLSGNNLWVSIYGFNRRLYGFNLNDLSQSPTVLEFNEFSSGALGTIQRAKDGNIYVSIDQYNYLGKIVNSEFLNSSVFNPNEIYLNGKLSRLGLPQLVYPLMTSPCLQEIILNSPEIYNDYNYQASNEIIIKDSYKTSSNNNIFYYSGNSISIKNDTHFGNGSTLLAKIASCETFLNRPSTENGSNIIKLIYIDGEENENPQDAFTMYPNPATDVVMFSKNIDVEIYTLNGKKIISERNTNRVDVSHLEAGVYLVKSANGNIQKLVIK